MNAFSKYVGVAILSTLVGISFVVSYGALQIQRERDAKIIADYTAACTKVSGVVAHDGQKRVCLK